MPSYHVLCVPPPEHVTSAVTADLAAAVNFDPSVGVASQCMSGPLPATYHSSNIH